MILEHFGKNSFFFFILVSPRRASEGFRGLQRASEGCRGLQRSFLGVFRAKKHLKNTPICLKTPQMYSKMILEHFGKNRFFSIFSYFRPLGGPRRASEGLRGRLWGVFRAKKRLKNTPMCLKTPQMYSKMILEHFGKNRFFSIFSYFSTPRRASEGLGGPQRTALRRL